MSLTEDKLIAVINPPFVESGVTETQKRQEMAPTTISPADVIAAISGQFRPSITGLTGGESNKLDGIVTVGVAAGLVQFVFIGEGGAFWGLLVGTGSDVENTDFGPILPDDYNASVPLVWKWIF